MRVSAMTTFADLDDFDDLGSLRKSVRKHIKKVGKVAKKAFMKAAPFLQIASLALNFIVPGLGVAVGLALSVASSALAAKEAQKAAKEAEKGAEAEAAGQEAAQHEMQARVQMAAAYDKAPEFFQKKYGMSRANFTGLPLEDQMRFMNLALYDQHAPKFAAAGITREQFAAKPLEEQAELMAQYGGGASAATFQVTPAETVRPEGGPSIGLLVGVGAGVLGLGLGLVFLMRKKK